MSTGNREENQSITGLLDDALAGATRGPTQEMLADLSEPSVDDLLAGATMAATPVAEPETPELLPNTVFANRYFVKELLGQGGAGAVYLVYDQVLKLDCALKLLHRSEHVEELMHEAGLAVRLNHPALLRYYEIAAHHDPPYLTMEEMNDGSLEEERLKNGGTLPVRRIVEVVSRVLEGLDYLHNAGHVHLDIKPQNILLGASGVKISDYGISKSIRQQIRQSGSRKEGTLAYMSPEQLRGEVCDRRADIYAVGMMIYRLRLGRLPFGMENHETWPFEGRRVFPDLGTSLRVIVERALSIDPSDRYPSAESFLKVLSLDRIDLENRKNRRDALLRRAAAIGLDLQLTEDVDEASLAQFENFVAAQEKRRLDDLSDVSERNAIELALCRVPASRFVRLDLETGASQRITLSQSFMMSQDPITQDLYEELMGTNPSSSIEPRAPVDCVTWRDAVAFCNALSEREGLQACYRIRSSGNVRRLGGRDGFRLPTEAEWECAALGDGQVSNQAWSEGNSDGHLRKVGQLDPNGYGLRDTLGNVWEWCGDFHGPYPRGSQEDPTGPSTGEARVCRGGSVASSPADISPRMRLAVTEEQSMNYLGFRVVRSC